MQILTQDANRRTNNAVQTAQLLEDQVTKLKNEYDSVVAQLETAKQRPLGQQQAASEEAQTQLKSLAALQAELAEKSSIYSYEHPVIKKLKKDIATLKQMIATAPQKVLPAEKPDQNEGLLQVLTQRETLLEKNLDDARNKLAMARLGESLEKSQQADHLAVIQYPELPGDPIKPKKAIVVRNGRRLSRDGGSGLNGCGGDARSKHSVEEAIGSVYRSAFDRFHSLPAKAEANSYDGERSWF